MTRHADPRVLVLNHFAVPRGQAGGTRHVELFSKLTGWEHLIIAGNRNPLTGEEQSAEPGFRPVKVISHRSNGWRRILGWIIYAASALLVGARQRRVDVVYASSPHLLAALAGWVIAVVRRVPFVMEVRDLWPQVLVDMGQLTERSPLFRVLRSLEVFLYSRAKAIVIMAEGTRDAIARLGIDSEKMVYIPNGADPEDFMASAPREVLRERFGFTRFTAVYTGAHGPANGLDLVLDAAEALREDEIDIVLVGGGVTKVALMTSADAKSLSNVHFLDPVAKDDLPDLLHAASVGIHCLADVDVFQYGISPNKIFDYMAAGLPVVTNCPGLAANLVSDAKCGIAAQPRGLAAAIREMKVADPAHLLACGNNGTEWITNNQSRTVMAGRLLEVLRRTQGDAVAPTR